MKKRFLSLLLLLTLFAAVFPDVNAEAASFNINFTPTCESIELVNLDTNTVVYSKNPTEKREPASITKIMTFIIASEHIDNLKGTNITVSKKVINELLGTGSSLSNIKAGDVLSAYQLLNCMMVPSGNDAALVIADYVGGGDVAKFVDMMNAKAKALGCTGTHFANPHGLHDANHYTTAADLVKITEYAMSLPYFMQITSQTRYSYSPAGGSDAGKNRLLVTTNYMIDKTLAGGKYYYKYAKGIKTGHTDESGYCLISSGSADGYSYLCVALGAPSVDAKGKKVSTRGEMIDSAALYRWALTSLSMKKVVSAGENVGEVQLKYAWNKDSLLLTAQKDCEAVLPKDVSVSSIIVKKDIPKYVKAPVKKGDVVGTATYSYADQKLATINLVASESVGRSELLHTTDVIKSIFTSVWFIVFFLIIVLLIAVYIVLAVIYNRKKKKLRKVKKYRKM
ncbi:MAG TPA: D-alanyl-D-alanine carboxypeptidase [Ruminococcaceae bacterium]|nr:D-alanyl-D-alanine carboxypeptidase [Oscillospiraceae bacterium]